MKTFPAFPAFRSLARPPSPRKALALAAVCLAAASAAAPVLAQVTLPRFSRQVSPRRTSVYVSLRGSISSAAWLDRVFAAPDATGPAGG